MCLHAAPECTEYSGSSGDLLQSLQQRYCLTSENITGYLLRKELILNCVLSFKTITINSLAYVSMLQNRYKPSRELHSPNTNLLQILHTKTVTGTHVFSYTVPQLWSVTSSHSLDSFCTKKLNVLILINLCCQLPRLDSKLKKAIRKTALVQQSEKLKKKSWTGLHFVAYAKAIDRQVRLAHLSYVSDVIDASNRKTHNHSGGI